MNGTITLESLYDDIQELKRTIEERKLFEEISDQLLELVHIDYDVSPLVGSTINEGEEFKLKFTFSINSLTIASSQATFNQDNLCNRVSFSLIYDSNCSPKKNSSGREIIEINSTYTGITQHLEYHQKLIDHGDLDNDGNNEYELRLFNLVLNEDPISKNHLPIEIVFHLVAANNINTSKPLARLYYQHNSEILALNNLRKEVVVNNDLVLPG
jgi:hypothetical protein